MLAEISHKNKIFKVNLAEPLDISIGLRAGHENPVAWYLGPPEIKPVQDGDFIGRVAEGASVNFNTIKFNPHAHGTHTECLGHISSDFHSVNQHLKQFFFTAKVLSLQPERWRGDAVITDEMLIKNLQKDECEALILRTLPNNPEKLNRKYSHTNWPYLTRNAAEYIKNCNVQHLLIDLPSVDKEKDDGKLLAHRAFWNYPEDPRTEATITEFIYVQDAIPDGNYLLNLQIAAFENDAAPSKPVLFKIKS